MHHMFLFGRSVSSAIEDLKKNWGNPNVFFGMVGRDLRGLPTFP